MERKARKSRELERGKERKIARGEGLWTAEEKQKQKGFNREDEEGFGIGRR